MSGKKCVSHEGLKRLLCFAFFFCFCLSAAAVAYPEDFVVLRVTLNGEDIGEYFLIRSPDDDIYMKREDLGRTRLKEGLGRDISIAGSTYVSLRSIPDLKFVLIEETAVLNIEAAPHLFRSQGIDLSYARPYDVIASRWNSAFLNYGLFYDPQNHFLDATSELGIRIGPFFGTTTQSYESDGADNKWVRLLTTVRNDDVEAMRTMRLGDVPAVSGILGSNLILGGLNVARNFETSPYFIQYPSLNIQGALKSPAQVEVYVNDQLIERTRLHPGKFVFDNVPAQTGPVDTRIVIKDIYGKEQVLETPFYFTDRLLKKGLHEYSYSIGFLRKNFGEKSFFYGKPAFLAFHNFGFSDQLEGGYFLEASKDILNLGPAFSMLLPWGGVAETAVRVSSADGDTGFGTFLGLTFKNDTLNTSFSLSYQSDKYRNVGAEAPVERPSIVSGAIGFSRKNLGSLSVNYSKTTRAAEPDITQYGFSFSRNIFRNIFLSAVAFRTKEDDREADNEFFLTLHFNLTGDITGTLSHSSDDMKGQRVTLRKNLPRGTGYAFSADIARREDETDISGEIKYQNEYGIFALDYTDLGEDARKYTLSAAGGIGYIDRSFFVSRPVTDSFAKVKVASLNGVRVYHSGTEVGRTGPGGGVIIPDLRSFYDNRISIEPLDIPVDYTIRETTKYVVSPFRSGTVIDFGVSRVQAFTGRIFILGPFGKIPAEYTTIVIPVEGGKIEGLVGKNGEFYLENLVPGKYPATFHFLGKTYIFTLEIPDLEGVLIDLGEIVIHDETRSVK